MNTIDLTEHRIDRQVDEMFGPARYGDYCRNPVTDASYIHGADPIEPQKEAAHRALRAREWFAINGPADAPPLPLSHNEREDLKGRGLLPHIVAWYARSLADRNYNMKEHPSFDDYASGVLWEAEFGFRNLFNYPCDEVQELKRRFPPRMLKGMDASLYWLPPKLHREVMAGFRRGSPNPEKYFNRE